MPDHPLSSVGIQRVMSITSDDFVFGKADVSDTAQRNVELLLLVRFLLEANRPSARVSPGSFDTFKRSTRGCLAAAAPTTLMGGSAALLLGQLETQPLNLGVPVLELLLKVMDHILQESNRTS